MDRRGDTIVADLSTGVTLTVPRRAIPGFAKASARGLSDVAITPGGEGLWSDTLDDGVSLEQLLVFAAGEMMLGTIGARINASKKSPARAAASRADGSKGGQPVSRLHRTKPFFPRAWRTTEPDCCSRCGNLTHSFVALHAEQRQDRR
jgi:hypothetical protein